jgi:glucose/arabinose dehydrogenase
MKYRVSFASAAIAALFSIDGLAQERRGERDAPEPEPAYTDQFRAPLLKSGYALQTRKLATGLEYPWAIAELPAGSGYLVTDRPGRLRHVAPDGAVSAPIEGVPEVENRLPDTGWATQAGLLDVKLGPDFAQDRRIYLTYAKPLPDDMSVTAAARAVLSEDMRRLTDFEEIFVQAPPSPTRMHYGSRIVFDERGHAFITTGEHSSLMERDFAQQLDKTYGKVIRVNLDGSIPHDNPFVGVEGADEVIWSYGHRNVQGAVMKDGFLFVLEHGPAGGDELNMPMPKRNYGWPLVSYGVRYAGVAVGTGLPRMAGLEEPLYFWDPVIAPGDLAVYEGDAFPAWNGDLLAGALVAGGLVRLDIEGVMVHGEERLLTELGRVRDVEVLSDGTLLVATDFADGALVHVTGAETVVTE